MRKAGVENYHASRGMMKMEMGTKLATAMGKPKMKKGKSQMGRMSY